MFPVQPKNIPSSTSQDLAKFAQRNMQLQCTIQDGQIWLSGGDESILVELETFKEFG